jgi:hypothetical protein
VFIPTPSIGDVVTFSFENNSRRDTPHNPKIYKLRRDVEWEEVVYSSFEEKQFLSGRY